MKKGIIGCGRICIFLINFFFLNFWFKQAKKADNHGNPEKCGNIDLLVYVCGELKKCVEGALFTFFFFFLPFNSIFTWHFDPNQR